MNAIHLLTDDIYFRIGFEKLVKTSDINTTHTLSILDDGVQFLYFIDTTCRSGRIPPSDESVDFFLERVKLVVPKNIHPEKLLQTIKSYCRGVYRSVHLTAGERRILSEMTSGRLSAISRAKIGVNYKAWHNFKASGFRRLGIKNTVTYMRAIHAWNAMGYSSVVTRVTTQNRPTTYKKRPPLLTSYYPGRGITHSGHF
ncbi:hypothetical protein [Enterobacter bugandensis]|uniref:hypothetical protein n=1 Tax=Enterobacter bugandensis TaxID=881260 RepID=UPI0021D21989|nr:hypothetical protein [Enterobacter bugandensis]MCU6172052.1 hypothetical protein [Enterobacter bugandensis]